MNVLVADDDRLVRYALASTLIAAGHQVREACNGLAVIAAVGEECPDAIVLDLMMPECNGFGVLRWLRENDPKCHIPVIVLSAFVVEAGGFEGYPHVVEVMQKPLYLDRLVAALGRCDHQLSAAA
jgi:CheY-like chemotaxis protein